MSYGGGGPAFGGPVFGSGGFFGGGTGGQYGAYPHCGCSSLFIIMAGVLLIFGGCLRGLNM